MKKWVCFSLLFCGFLFATPLVDRNIDPAALSQLIAALDIPPDADLIAETQKRWLRKPSQERWEITELSQNQRQFVLNWAANQGLYAAWKPVQSHYDKALILGATTSFMQMRLAYLKQLWEEGVRFDEIVWLTGDRPLDQRADGLTDRCSNESEAARIIWEEASLPLAMRNLPVVFVAVPMKGSIRPNTQDTVYAWLEVSLPCTALFVSDQPFCGYQYGVIDSTLPADYNFDLVGQGVDPTSHPAAAAITLDSLARWLYISGRPNSK